MNFGVLTTASRSFLANKAQINATNTTAISYNGWSQATDNNVPVPGLPPVPFYQTDLQGAFATFQFNGEAIEVHGDLNFGHGQFTIVSVIYMISSGNLTAS